MSRETVIQTLKTHYPRDIRKQLIKTVLVNEKSNDIKALQHQYHLINQIFSYVLKECNWTMPTDSTKWDREPLEIMIEVFPKLDTTRWYQEQALLT